MTDGDQDCDQDWNISAEQAAAVIVENDKANELVLLRSLSPDPRIWEPFLEDPDRRSFAYVVRGSAGLFSADELDEWYRALHPDTVDSGSVGGWTDSAYRGQKLLRKTAWYVRPPCTCAYDYADTHQEVVSDERFRASLEKITRRVSEACGIVQNPPNSVNLNYYPAGGGVGWHADDEPLFDGLRRDAAIISLSLAAPGGDSKAGSRWFEVKPKHPFSRTATRKLEAVEFRHGDLMTMEGLFQLHYLHSIWPGDRTDIQEARGRNALGERINLTWRWVTRHTKTCPVACTSDSK